MRIAVVTLFPVMIREALAHGVVGRALERGVLKVEYFDPRDDTSDVHRTVDDRPYGGGPGMVLKVEPLRSALRRATAAVPQGSRRVYLGADGRRVVRVWCWWRDAMRGSTSASSSAKPTSSGRSATMSSRAASCRRWW